MAAPPGPGSRRPGAPRKGDDEPRAAGRLGDLDDRRRGRRRSRGRSRGPGRSLRRARHGGPAETLEDLLPVRGRHPRPGVAHPEPHRPRVVRRPDGDGVALAGVLDRVVGELEQRLRDPLRVQAHGDLRGGVGLPVRGPNARAFAITSSVSSARSTSPRETKSGRSDLASRIRSLTRRAIRSTSSSSRSRVSATSSGSAVSSSSRWPRSTVSGVFSSCPASSRNRRCPTNADSSRSSMPLTVRVSAVMSSLPVSGIRRDRSVSPISSAALRSVRNGASRRPDCQAARPVTSPRESAETIA